MSFASVLDTYCMALGCANKEIAERCSISASALSRYRSGNRVPDDESLRMLATGISEAARAQSIASMADSHFMYKSLLRALNEHDSLGPGFGMRLDAVMASLQIRNSEIARHAGVDPSFISRVRSGQRAPSDQPSFARACSDYIAYHCLAHDDAEALSPLIVEASDVISREAFINGNYSELSDVIGKWLLGEGMVQADVQVLEEFFEWLSELDLDSVFEVNEDHECSTSVNNWVSTAPHSCFYYGSAGMLQAEFDFLDIALKTNAQSIWYGSDVPLDEEPFDAAFYKKRDEKIKQLVRKGCHLRIFHSIDRSLSDIIAIMKQWIPYYLQGNVTPRYLQGMTNRLFMHMNCVCETCVLSSEAVAGHQVEGRYYLSTLPEDIEYYSRKMRLINEMSSSMLQIYHESDSEKMAEFNRDQAMREEKGLGRELCPGRFRNLRIKTYPGDCTIITMTGKMLMHIVIRMPKMRYAISFME